MINHQATISIAIATYNESSNMDRFLKSVENWVDEIILVDGNSQDDTVKIASRSKKVKIINTDNKPIFHINKQMAINACSSDWILQLDADEVVTPELRQEILKLLSHDPQNTQFDGYWIKRKNYFLGKFLKKGGAYPDPSIRLYKRGKAKLPCLDVHEQAVVEGQVGWLKNDLEHYADPHFSRYLLRSNRYTSIEAQQLINSGIKISLINYFFLKPIFRFLQMYLRHKGFVDGFPGFVFAFFSGIRFPIVYTKYYELKKAGRKINIREDWD